MEEEKFKKFLKRHENFVWGILLVLSLLALITSIWMYQVKIDFIETPKNCSEFQINIDSVGTLKECREIELKDRFKDSLNNISEMWIKKNG